MENKIEYKYLAKNLINFPRYRDAYKTIVNLIIDLDYRLSINENIIREDIDMLRLKRESDFSAMDFDSKPKKKVKG